MPGASYGLRPPVENAACLAVLGGRARREVSSLRHASNFPLPWEKYPLNKIHFNNCKRQKAAFL